jgi:hypothetical protein
MPTTTKYATWTSVFGLTLSPRDDVNNFAGEYGAAFDLDAIEADYRTTVAALLPGSMQLVGDTFIADVIDYEISWDWFDAVHEQVGLIDMSAIFEAHDDFHNALSVPTPMGSPAPAVDANGHDIWGLWASLPGRHDAEVTVTTYSHAHRSAIGNFLLDEGFTVWAD